MSVTQTPAPARSDVTTSGPRSGEGGTRPYRRHGTMLTVGAAAWASAIAVFGLNAESLTYQVVHNLTAFSFQLGVLALVRVLWRTGAIGSGRLARTFLRIETGLLSLAILSTLSDLVGLTNLDNPASLALDLCWPLSMLGMFLIGIRIAVAGRWKGLSRFWPIVAESWAVVVVPTMGLVGEGAARWVAVAHLLVGYSVLGQIVARKRGPVA